MSLHEYLVSRELHGRDYPFYALVMAAMRKADDVNLDKLSRAFPAVHEELQRRYDAPGGRLPDEDQR